MFDLGSSHGQWGLQTEKLVTASAINVERKAVEKADSKLHTDVSKKKGSSMSKRIQIAGIVLAQNADGKTTKHPYTGSYSEPVHDRLGLLSFGWKAVVDGAKSQPEPRTVIVRTPGFDVAPDFVTRRIETAIVEHLGGRNLDHAALP